MEFYFESNWVVGMFQKSQGKLMSVVTKIFLIRQTVFFFTDIWETVLFMRCDESHTMTVLIFFIPRYFLLYWAEAYIINTSSFPKKILHAFFN